MLKINIQIMSEQISCPNCGTNFNVNEALTGQIEKHFKAEFHKKLKNALEAEKSKMQKQASKLVESQISDLEKENQKQYQENVTLQREKVELLKKEKELNRKEQNLQLEMDKKLLEEQSKIEEQIIKKEQEKFSLERAQWQKKVEDAAKQAEESARKARQGSIQLQGEVQELALESLLEHEYPFDKIDEVPKGVKGADCIQTVINSSQNICGKIVYESKKTKTFSNGWIEKLKQDQMKCNADIPVLVTQTMPNGMDRFGMVDGVWICGFHEVKSLSLVLRESLLKLQLAKGNQVNKGEKMELLYDYLTSNEFVQVITRIIENYQNMHTQLAKEKTAMTKIWKEREKQIWVVKENLSVLFGSIKGIAGSALDNSDLLELPDNDQD